MPRFRVVTKTPGGETHQEEKFGPSRQEILAEIKSDGRVPISIELVDDERQQASRPRKETAGKKFGKLKVGELALGFRTLSTMLEGGLPILDCLVEVAEQSDSDRFREVFLSVAGQVRRGTSLSEALVNHQPCFSPMICSMVKAGEESGTLTEVLRNLSDHLEGQVELRRKVKAGTRYPIFILFFFAGVVAIVFLVIIPKFRDIFSNVGMDMPPLTKAVMGMSSAIASNIIFIVPAIAVVIGGLYYWKKTESGQRAFDLFFLRLPVIGSIVHEVIMARMTAALALLIDSGMSIVDAIRLSSAAAGNAIVAEQLTDVRRNIVRGSSLSRELREHPVFPRLLVSMCAAGEESGRMGEMLSRVAHHYERESATAIEGLLSLLEPAILVFLGVTVGVVVMAIYLPIFKLAQAVQ